MVGSLLGTSYFLSVHSFIHFFSCMWCLGPVLGVGESMVRKIVQGPHIQGAHSLEGETSVNPEATLVAG